MTFPRRRLIASGLLAFACLGAWAQDNPVRLVVGFPPGDTSDVLARMLIEPIRQQIGQPVIVDNRAGAGGMIAAEATKNAVADGRMLMLTPLAPMVTFPYTFAKINYDPIKDYEPVTLLATFDLAIAVNAATGPRTMAEFAERIRKEPLLTNFGSPAAGSLPHMFGLELGRVLKTPTTHVAYRGDAPAKQDLMGGVIGFVVAPTAAFIELEKSGRVRILATSGKQRSPGLPHVPTLKESGVDLEGSAWFALFAPAKTPKDVVDKISKAAMSAMSDPAIRKRLNDLELQPAAQGPASLAETLVKDQQRWSAVIRDSGFKASN